MTDPLDLNVHYIRELEQRLERLRAYIVRHPVWRQKVQLRQHRQGHWQRARKHTNAGHVLPLSLIDVVSTAQTKAAAKKIQVPYAPE